MVLFGSSGKRARLMGSVLLIVTFIAGALAGAALLRVVSAERPEMRVAEPRVPRGGPRRLLLDEQFTKEIGLSADQRARITAILDRRDAETRQMWAEFEPRLKAFAESTRREIGQVLTSEQQARLDRAVEERRANWRRQRHGCPPDSGKQEVREEAR